MAQTIIGGVKPPAPEPIALPKEYRHPLVESRYVPHTSLLSFVPGSPTLVEYYRGYYGADEEQHSFQPESIETYQSYTRIRNLILKVDNGQGNYNFVPDSGQSTHQLTGYVLFDLTPNKGDVFIKDIGDGQAGLYVITEQPEIKTINADKVYYFEAMLETVVDAAIAANLNSKVVKELYYSKESAVSGGNAVLSKSDWDNNLELERLRFAIMDDLLANCYFSDEDTIIVPNSDGDRLYDPYLAKFLSYVIPSSEIAPRNKIQLLNVNYYVDNRSMKEPVTIWDMFYRNDFKHPERYKHTFWVHNRASLINTRFYGNVFYSKMDRVITIHEEGAMRNPYLYSGALVPSPIPSVPANTAADGVQWDYFFGEDFYTGGGTELQQFIWKMFRDRTVDKQGVLDEASKYWGLSDVEKLYMGGIYIAAIKVALRNSSDYT